MIDIRKFMPNKIRRIYRNAKLVFTSDMEFTLRRLNYDENSLRGIAEQQLTKAYPELIAPKSVKAEINKYEAKIYSQFGEDGILLYLFSKLGATNRFFVEFGISDGRENNSTNLLLNFGWSGFGIEGNQITHRSAVNFYRSMLPGPAAQRIKTVCAMVTAENINGLLRDNNATGEIDLLSIDIDSNDYWVWKEIKEISPRIVVIEYNGVLGNNKPITVSYNPNFRRFEQHAGGYYHGASLPAVIKLGKEKGYTFVGCESSGGANAFFVRSDIAQGKIEAVTAEQGFYPQARRIANLTQEQQWDQIKHLPFTEV